MKIPVFQAIDSERRHQKEKFPGHHHPVSEYLLIMEKCLLAAKRRWHIEGDTGALDEVRQVTAVGVACMEQHGAINRGLREVSTEDPETAA